MKPNKLVFTTLALSLSLLSPLRAQESTPAEPKSRHEVLKDTFAPLAAKLRLYSVKVGQGYGVLVEGGWLLTSATALGDETRPTIRCADGKTGEAQLVKRDPAFNIAVLKVSEDFGGARLASSKDLSVGQFVLSIGLADRPVAAGVVSALNRAVEAAPQGELGSSNFLADLFGGNDENKGAKFSYKRVVQHDSKIEEELYGSPVYTADGALVGLNVERAYRGSSYFVAADDLTAILSGTDRGAVAPPAPAAPREPKRPATPDKPAAPASGYLGVTVESRSGGPALREAGFEFGVEITEVAPDSGSAKAGLAKKDIIVMVEGVRLTSFDHFASLVAGRKVGETIVMTVVRGGWSRRLTVTLGSRPD
jgi:S1-C subfamily serine protease